MTKFWQDITYSGQHKESRTCN